MRSLCTGPGDLCKVNAKGSATGCKQLSPRFLQPVAKYENLNSATDFDPSHKEVFIILHHYKSLFPYFMLQFSIQVVSVYFMKIKINLLLTGTFRTS